MKLLRNQEEKWSNTFAVKRKMADSFKFKSGTKKKKNPYCLSDTFLS